MDYPFREKKLEIPSRQRVNGSGNPTFRSAERHSMFILCIDPCSELLRGCLVFSLVTLSPHRARRESWLSCLDGLLEDLEVSVSEFCLCPTERVDWLTRLGKLLVLRVNQADGGEAIRLEKQARPRIRCVRDPSLHTSTFCRLDTAVLAMGARAGPSIMEEIGIEQPGPGSEQRASLARRRARPRTVISTMPHVSAQEDRSQY